MANSKTILELVKEDGRATGVNVSRLPVFVKKEGRYWFAYSPQFKTLGFVKGGSEDAAVNELKKSLDIFFDIHLERGTLEKAIYLFGWEKNEKTTAKSISFKRPKIGHSSILTNHLKNTNYSRAVAC